MTLIKEYDFATELHMATFYNSLSEKDRRLYAAAEAIKFSHGGITYISNVLNCDRDTISKGIVELKNPDSITKDGIRKKGGGRKLNIENIPDINEKFILILYNFTAGDPMDHKVRWTHLTHQQIANKLKEEGIDVSRKIVKQLFKKHGYVKRKAQKSLSTGNYEYRNEQFELIAELKALYEAQGNPVMSIDTKKKEFVGNLYRDGYCYTTDIQKVFDHDFPHLAEGIMIPHGLYDITRNEAYVNIGTSKDTSEFACDSIRQWWYNAGRYHYVKATSILLLCDAGGSNSYRHHIFKEDLLKLADEIGIEIRVAHYPPYCSKWNPIEHRLFCHITRSLQGVILESVGLTKKLIERTTTSTGLKVTVNIIKKVYQTGRKVAQNFKKNMRIIFDEKLGKLNYIAVPLKE